MPGSIYCANHHPERQEQRREATRRAAKVSHAPFRPDPELEAWADTIDFSTKESRERCLAEAAQLIAKGGLTAAQGNAIAALARAASMKPEKAPGTPAPVLVEVARFTNGQEARS